jgi:hypothetical protein
VKPLVVGALPFNQQRGRKLASRRNARNKKKKKKLTAGCSLKRLSGAGFKVSAAATGRRGAGFRDCKK